MVLDGSRWCALRSWGFMRPRGYPAVWELKIVARPFQVPQAPLIEIHYFSWGTIMYFPKRLSAWVGSINKFSMRYIHRHTTVELNFKILGFKFEVWVHVSYDSRILRFVTLRYTYQVRPPSRQILCVTTKQVIIIILEGRPAGLAVAKPNFLS